MSPKAFVRAGLALIALTAAACSETIAPTLERIEAQIANAFICTIVWTGAAGDGMWQSADNWAPARLPNSSDNACVTTDGVVATLYGDASVNSLTIGTPGSASPATLQVRGNRIGSTGPAVPANLSVANGIDNSGVMSLDATGHGPGPVTINVNGGTLENRAGGRLLLLAKDFGAGSGLITHYVNGNVVNDGTVEIRMYAELRGHYTNRGTVIIAENPNIDWEGPNHIQLINGSWRQDAGELRVDTRFWVNDGTFRLNHGAITGSASPILYRGTLLIGTGSTATGQVTVREAVTFSGNVYANQTLVIDGNRPSTTGFIINTDVTAASSFTNSGVIRLTGTGHAGGTAATLVVSNNGTITNNGRIETTVPDAGGRSISGSITNTAAGTISIQASTTLGQPGAIYRNSGNLSIEPNATLAVTTPGAFVQQGGTLAIKTGGAYNQTNGAFNMDGGEVTGIPWLARTIVTINNASVPATLRLTDVTVFSGNIGAQQKLIVESIRPFTTGPGIQADLNTQGNVNNAGTITLMASGFNAGSTTLRVSNGTLTNTGRIEALFDPSETHRMLVGNIVNQGTIHATAWTEILSGTLKSIAPATITGGGTLNIKPGASLMASGNMTAHVHSEGNLTVGDGPGALDVTGNYSAVAGSSVAVQIGGSPAAPGTDFDRLTFTGPMTFGNGTLQVSAVAGACIDGGKSFEVMRYSHFSGNFLGFSGLNLGGGRTVQPVQQATNYLLNVVGPSCAPADVTPPVITANVTGTFGRDFWYVSDVNVSWTVTDAESAVSSKTGCDDVTLTTDNAGITYTCSATSAGGDASKSVTIKRDATPPVVETRLEPEANAHGWNNTDVVAFYTVTDAMSGTDVPLVTWNFVMEGERWNDTRDFFDRAGNVTWASTEVSIDKTAPVVTVTRSPLAGPDGWNDTDVTATWNATDALSGIAGSWMATMLFDQDGANQSGSRSFTDLAGNSASATIDGINIHKTPLAPVCSATPGEIWPANNRMTAVRVTVGGSRVTGYRLRSVTNNETGPADVEGWAIGTADVEGLVLAGRNGGGSGRIYTLTYDVFGTGGATASCSVTVRVPHDQGKGK